MPNFLSDMGVKPLDVLQLVRDWLLPQYRQGAHSFSVEENRAHVRFVIQALAQLPQTQAAEINTAAAETPFLRCYQGTEKRAAAFKTPREAYLSSVYSGSDDLEVFFGPDADVWFVDDGYVGDTPAIAGREEEARRSARETWLKALKGLGVAASPRLQPIPDATLSDASKQRLRNGADYKNDIAIEDFTLDGLGAVLSRIGQRDPETRRVSLALWRLLARLVPNARWARNPNYFAVGTYRWTGRSGKNFHAHR